MEAPLSLLSRNFLSRAAIVAGNSNLNAVTTSSRMCSTSLLPAPAEFRPAKALVLTKTSRFEYERARHKGESSLCRHLVHCIHRVWFITDTSNFRLVCPLEFPYMDHATSLT